MLRISISLDFSVLTRYGLDVIRVLWRSLKFICCVRTPVGLLVAWQETDSCFLVLSTVELVLRCQDVVICKTVIVVCVVVFRCKRVGVARLLVRVMRRLVRIGICYGCWWLERLHLSAQCCPWCDDNFVKHAWRNLCASSIFHSQWRLSGILRGAREHLVIAHLIISKLVVVSESDRVTTLAIDS